MYKKIFLGLSLVLVGIISAIIISGSLFAKSTVELADAQKDALLFMYQEEKLARDVYIVLGQKYPAANTFANIQLSEQQHMDAVEKLCVKYGVDISQVDESAIGVFILTDLQNLYNTLIAQGSVSLDEGLKVGITIEEKDLTDIVTYEEGMPDDVVKVFENLRAGSLNHLNAFQTALLAAE
ncbi:DUF2202 domain-containing protein [Sulfuricurvum sp.]|uniref:DUF2202 domain-containing protein n=1 Tax=Sulfuricurvum sp. TaxID=2025608 RepID=UPI003BB02FB7